MLRWNAICDFLMKIQQKVELSSVSLFTYMLNAEVRLQIAKLLTWKHDRKVCFWYFRSSWDFRLLTLGFCSALHITNTRDDVSQFHKIINLLISFSTCWFLHLLSLSPHLVSRFIRNWRHIIPCCNVRCDDDWTMVDDFSLIFYFLSFLWAMMWR